MAIIKSIMKTDLHVANFGDSIATVSEKMGAHNEGAILVYNKGKLAGIFSERDLLKRVISRQKDPASVKIEDVMTKDPITVKAGTHIRDCVKLVREKGFRHLPVVDENDVPIGIISTRDFLQYIVDALETLIDEADYKDKIEQGVDPYEFIGGSYNQ
jgi:CBS domain-containing protein